MTDLVYLLRHPMQGTETSERNIMKMAADEIERLRGSINLLLDIIDNYDISRDLCDEDGDVIETIRKENP